MTNKLLNFVSNLCYHGQSNSIYISALKTCVTFNNRYTQCKIMHSERLTINVLSHHSVFYAFTQFKTSVFNLFQFSCLKEGI